MKDLNHEPHKIKQDIIKANKETAMKLYSIKKKYPNYLYFYSVKRFLYISKK